MTKPRRTGGGRPTISSETEEAIIVSALEFTAQFGFPRRRPEVKRMVKSYIQSIGRKRPFKNDNPGEDWMVYFEKRHSEQLNRRKPEILTFARAEGLTTSVLNAFFDMCEDILDTNNPKNKHHCIFNLGETRLNTNRRSEALFVPKSTKDAYLKSPTAGKFSVLFCVSATGVYLPPFTVYKAHYLYQTWTIRGPHGAAVNINDILTLGSMCDVTKKRTGDCWSSEGCGGSSLRSFIII